MKVCFCDVCGNPTPTPTMLRLEKAPTMTEGDFELCVPCKAGLLKFLSERRAAAKQSGPDKNMIPNGMPANLLKEIPGGDGMRVEAVDKREFIDRVRSWKWLVPGLEAKEIGQSVIVGLSGVHMGSFEEMGVANVWFDGVTAYCTARRDVPE